MSRRLFPHLEITGVFEIREPIRELGGRPGDRLVVRPWRDDVRRCVLVRPLGAGGVAWAFRSVCAFEFARPALPREAALADLRATLGIPSGCVYPPSAARDAHLTLL